jgi:antirestriction protein
MSYTLKLENGRRVHVSDLSEEEINKTENRYNSMVCHVCHKDEEHSVPKHSLGGFILGAGIGTILANSVLTKQYNKQKAKRTKTSSESSDKKTSTKTTPKAAATSNKKTYLPNGLVKSIDTTSKKRITNKDIVDGVNLNEGVKVPANNKYKKVPKNLSDKKLTDQTNYLPKRQIASVNTTYGKSFKREDLRDGAYIKKGVKFAEGGSIRKKDENYNYIVNQIEVNEKALERTYGTERVERIQQEIQRLKDKLKNEYGVRYAEGGTTDSIKEEIFKKYGLKVSNNSVTTNYKSTAEEIAEKYDGYIEEDGSNFRVNFKDQFAKGGNVSSIEKKVNEVNRLIELANKNDISVVDSSSTWESPMKYKPIKYSNGTLYIEYEELDLYKYNRTGVSNWVTKKDKILKRNMEFDNPLNEIAKMYRKALKSDGIEFAEGGVISENELEQIASDYAYATSSDYDRAVYRLLDSDYTNTLLPKYISDIKEWELKNNTSIRANDKRYSELYPQYAEGGGVDSLDVQILTALSGFNDGRTIQGVLETLGYSNYRFNKYASESDYKKVEKELNNLVKKGYVTESGIGFEITKAGSDYRRNKYAKGGTVEENLLKELHKLQRDLNSSRLSQYREGDTSEEEMARQRERESKLARFNEVLQLLRELDNKKYALGGGIDSDETPKIYVADLAAYNEGKLVGKWLDLTDYSDADDLMAAIQDLMSDFSEEQGVTREEWAIHDYENFPSSFYSEYMGRDEFEKIYQLMEAANDRDIPYEVLGEAMSMKGSDDPYEVADNYNGEYDSFKDFAYQLVDDIGISGVSNPDFYFDYEGFGSDERINMGSEEEAEYGYEGLSDEDLGYELVEQVGGLEGLSERTREMYFDYDKFARDLEYDYDEIRMNGMSYIFFSSYKRGGVPGRYNTGRSWKMDRARHNSKESYEKAIETRKSYKK